MESSLMKEQAARCRSLADMADPFTRQRLLDLAAKYEGELTHPSRASRASRAIKAPVDLTVTAAAP